MTNEGGKVYIPFKKNATGKARGSTLWSKIYHYFQINRDDFMDHYQKRSNIEATNTVIKRKSGETLKSKNLVAKVNELLAKIIAYNLTVVIHEIYENGIELNFIRVINISSETTELNDCKCTSCGERMDLEKIIKIGRRKK